MLGVTLVALNVVYLPRRYVPMKFLLPGLFFLAVFGVYPVLYTAYASTTNYGTGFVLSKDQAIDQIQSQSIGRAEEVDGVRRHAAARARRARSPATGSTTRRPRSSSSARPTGSSRSTSTAELQVLTTTGRTFVVSVGDLEGVRPGDVDTLPGYPADPESYVMPGRDGGLRDPHLRRAGRSKQPPDSSLRPRRRASITDTETGTVYTRRRGPVHGAGRHGRCSPGFTTGVGFDNYREMLTGAEFRGAFLRVLVVERSPSPLLSVFASFALGLLLAMVFNDKRMRGRKFYRSLLIIPYALPAFMMALVFRGMLNRTFGINRWLGIDVGWLETPALAMFSLVLVNMWLGYPYMFLVSTGALQSIPTDLKEAAFVDGATGSTTFRKITLPLLLTAVSPLLDRQLRLQLQQLHARLPAHPRRAAQQRRERRVDRPADHVDVPHRPRRRAQAPGPRRRAVGADLHHRRRRSRRSGSSTPRPTRRSVMTATSPRRFVDDAATTTGATDPGPRPALVRRDRLAPRRRHAGMLFALFPVWFVLIAAFSENGTLSGQTLLPESVTIKQYHALVDNYPYWHWFFNSLIVSLVVAFGTVLLASLAAYAFSRLRFKGRRPGLLALLLIQMFPASLAFVAIYIMVDQLDDTYPAIGAGTIIAIMLFYLGGALGANAWLIKGFFDTIPRDLDESAQIDGATHNQTFFKIILPLAAPVLAIIFLLSFIASQAEFLIAPVIMFGKDISSPDVTAAVGLRGLLAGDRYDLRWGPFAMGALILAIPVVLLFQFLQRYIVSGITAGAVKG